MLRRAIKNKVKNYTTPEILVREATSNDPWGPSTRIMADISDFTYNVLAFNQVMQKLWKRMNDKHKNWRHIYKSLVLLDYLIKTGSPAVAEQSRQNIESIRTLHDFQFFEGCKDLGVNVREKSRVVVELLQDEELLKIERKQALAAKDKFSQGAFSIGSRPGMMGGRELYDMGRRSSGQRFPPSSLRMSDSTPDLSRFGTNSRGRASDEAFTRNSTYHRPDAQERPDEMDEELQMALEISRKEHEDAVRRRREEEEREDVKLKLAMVESLKEETEFYDILQDDLKPQFSFANKNISLEAAVGTQSSQSVSKPQNDLDLLGIDPWSTTPTVSQNLPFNSSLDPFSAPVIPSTSFTMSVSDPWGDTANGNLVGSTNKQSYDPWASGGMTYLGFADKIPYNKSAPEFSDEKQFHVSTAVPAREDDLFGVFDPPSYEKVAFANESKGESFSPFDDMNISLGESYSLANNPSMNSSKPMFYKSSPLEMNFEEESVVNISPPKKETVKDFLSQNSFIVDLNNIATLPKGPPVPQYRFQMTPDGHSTFAKPSASTSVNNPFTLPPSKATLNEIARKDPLGMEDSASVHVGGSFSFTAVPSIPFSPYPSTLSTSMNTRPPMQPSLNPFL